MKNNLYVHVPFNRLEELLGEILAEKINIELYFSSDSLESCSVSRLKEYNDILNEAKIQVIFHGPYIDLSPGAFDESVRELTQLRFLKTIEFAKILSAKSIVLHPGYESLKHDMVFDKWLQNSLKTWNFVKSEVEETGISIHIENIFEKKPNVALALLDAIDSHSFGYCMDTGHFNMFSDISLESWLEKTSKYLREFHMHNNYGLKDSHNNVQDGTFDFNELLSLIDRFDITAKYTIEAHGIDKVRKSLEYFYALS